MSAWLSNAVFYQIYPQSFRDSNADGIGDLPGILEKLEYIQKLGCNAIWINPCFDSPFQDAGYDIADYYTVAPRYGNNTDLRHIFQAAHQLGMHVILDLVPHTSDRHPWFLESMKGPDNEFSKRYVWTDNRSQCFDLKRPGWDQSSNIRAYILGVGARDGLCAVNYYTCQPCLNYGFEKITDTYQSGTESPEAIATREAIMDVMRFWLRMGCDGFRVDMAGTLVKNDPEGQGNVRLWRHFRDFLDREFPEAVMISEWGRPEFSLLAGFHMDFLLHNGPSHYMDLFRTEHPFFSREGRGDVSEFVRTYEANAALTAGKGLICIPFGNHDMSRLAGMLDQEEMKIAFAFLLSMPGAPFLYYGDEIGMRWIDGLPSKEGSRSYRAGSRTPMQWADDLNDGFSDARPDRLYLPLDPTPAHPTAEAQMAAPNSLWQEVHRLIALRQSCEALQSEAPVTFLYAEPNRYPLVYERTGKTGRVLVVCNPGRESQTCPLDRAALGTEIYCHGQSATLEQGLLTAPGKSISFFYCEN